MQKASGKANAITAVEKRLAKLREKEIDLTYAVNKAQLELGQVKRLIGKNEEKIEELKNA